MKDEKISALLEIGCEEIPARFMPELISDLREKASQIFLQNRLEYSSLQTFGTMRRLVLHVDGLAQKQLDLEEEIKGPPKEIAYDQSGSLTQAGLGFMRKNNINPENLFVKQENNRNFICAKIKRRGEKTEAILKPIFPQIISSLYLPVSMRWGAGEHKFIRPIHWIVALMGRKVIKFEYAGIRSSDVSYGHRFAKSPKVKILSSDFGKYISALKKKYVIVDQDEREKLIAQMVLKAAPKALLSSDLLSEVMYLVETPFAILCSFNPDFLALPKEILITSMKKNQKYSPVMDSDDKLAPKFVVVTNGCKNKKVKRGNEKVISARLTDAKFFFDEDQKIPLKTRAHGLEKVQFFEGLGNLHEKTERLKKLSVIIAGKLNYDKRVTAQAEKAAGLAKADLITQMVFEFPELQGTMGREYALLDGEDKAVADAIYEHYLPRSAEDSLPKTPAGTVLSLADKFDTLAGCFALGKIPTGSADPYGLRRAVYGIIKIIIDKKIKLSLKEVFAEALKNYNAIIKDIKFDLVYRQLLEFIGVRLKAHLLDEKISHDVIDAAFANLDDILFAYQVSQVLNKLRGRDFFVPLVKTHDRSFRISSQSKLQEIKQEYFTDPAEKSLYEAYVLIGQSVGKKLSESDIEGAIIELSKLIPAVDLFFEKVLVMHHDENIKANRLALLKLVSQLFLKVADMRKIVV